MPSHPVIQPVELEPVRVRKVINLNNYVCSRYAWITAMIPTSNINRWNTLRNENQRLWRFIDPPAITPLLAFFTFDAKRKGWTWTPALENCYGFLITYFIDPNLIIMSADQVGGSDAMEKEQAESPGFIPLDLNIPILSDIDNMFSDFLESIGLSIPTWFVYLGLVAIYVIKKK